MGYYKGDFYGRGGYYRGDPGFFSFLGGLGKAAVGLIPGVGPALAGGLEALTARKAGTAIVKASEGTLATRAAGKMTSIITKHPVLSAAGGAGLLCAANGVAGKRLVDGAEKMLGVGHRKRRRLEAGNPRALWRAIRSAHAFQRTCQPLIRFSFARR